MKEGPPPVDIREALGNASITEINYYPIKSCLGVSVDSADIVQTGIKHDRELMVVAGSTFRRKEKGDFLTQRELPRMSLIIPEITDDSLRIEAPRMPVLEIPLLKEGKKEKGVVWGNSIDSVDQGEDAAKWLSEFLGIDTRLVRKADDFIRKAGSYRARDEDQVAFADGYPFLMISEESRADLNNKLPQPLPMNRFRPNIVIAGNSMPYTEDQMKRVQIGGITFNVVKPCIRCVITTTDQGSGLRASGEMKGEPLATLADYRKIRLGDDQGAIFGQNLTHENTGRISIGDKIEVLETKQLPTFI